MLTENPSPRAPGGPRVIARDQHDLSRQRVSPNALKVLYRLKDCGHEPFLVGGCVRDLLLGLEPKDFDVATDATPEQVRSIFRNCRLIGRRFRLAHIHFGRDYVEVATFRGTGGDDEAAGQRRLDDDGRLLADNIYGTIEEDAVRRDFTINALYYDIRDFSVRDYVGGFDDLQAGVLRLIGEPEERYREDPVRLLRAVRFAAKLGFRIDPATEAPLSDLGGLLESIPPARLFEEVLKLLLTGIGVRCYELLHHYGLVEHLFPASAGPLGEDPAMVQMLRAAMENTDQRVAEGKPVTPAFLFATLLWPVVSQRTRALLAEGSSEAEALAQAADEAIAGQVARVAIPRRFSMPMREIWQLQPRFQHRTGKRARRLLEHPRFRAAYDFLLLRIHQEPELAELGEFWTSLQEMEPAAMAERLAAPRGGNTGRRRRRRRSPRTNSPTRDPAT